MAAFAFPDSRGDAFPTIPTCATCCCCWLLQEAAENQAYQLGGPNIFGYTATALTETSVSDR